MSKKNNDIISNLSNIITKLNKEGLLSKTNKKYNKAGLVLRRYDDYIVAVVNSYVKMINAFRIEGEYFDTVVIVFGKEEIFSLESSKDYQLPEDISSGVSNISITDFDIDINLDDDIFDDTRFEYLRDIWNNKAFTKKSLGFLIDLYKSVSYEQFIKIPKIQKIISAIPPKSSRIHCHPHELARYMHRAFTGKCHSQKRSRSVFEIELHSVIPVNTATFFNNCRFSKTLFNVIIDSLINLDRHVISIILSKVEIFNIFTDNDYARNNIGYMKKYVELVVNIATYADAMADSTLIHFVSAILRLHENKHHIKIMKTILKIIKNNHLFYVMEVITNMMDIGCILQDINLCITTEDLEDAFKFPSQDSAVVDYSSNILQRLEGVHGRLLDYYREVKDYADNAHNKKRLEIEREYDELIKDREKELIDKYGYKDDNFSIVIPSGVKDIKAEGVCLNHCVGDYIEDVATSATTVVFIRKNDDLETPYYTMEIKDDSIVQVKGYNNKSIIGNKKLGVFITGFEDYIRAQSNMYC